MKAAAKNIIKVSLELGGKAPVIVCKDAGIDLAVEVIKANLQQWASLRLRLRSLCKYWSCGFIFKICKKI